VLLSFLGKSNLIRASALLAFSSKYGSFVALLGIVGAVLLICVSFKQSCIQRLQLFAFVARWNKRRLVESTQYGVNYTLNERFQLTGVFCGWKLYDSLENIRASEMLFASIIFGCGGIILPILLLLSINFFGNTQFVVSFFSI
jgi:hypothetical protein